MNNSKILSSQILENTNFEKTRKNLTNFFIMYEKLEWEWAKLNAQRGLTTNYDFSSEYQRQPYMPIGKDMFNLSKKEYKEEQLKSYISSYYWAKSILSAKEQLYIEQHFVNCMYEDKLIDLLGFNSIDSREFRKFKKSTIYKFADFLNLVENKI